MSTRNVHTKSHASVLVDLADVHELLDGLRALAEVREHDCAVTILRPEIVAGTGIVFQDLPRTVKHWLDEDTRAWRLQVVGTDHLPHELEGPIEICSHPTCEGYAR
ncbi:hypothetical protein GCM10009733_020230 [Nonomuraea maheshkhaliensis]|uniref:Uncharacterized protein n=1 Tax=Nonomuraea maheshkhaliensis TaxID=419590 RepID=A0ABP4QUN4_9ACTN